MILPPTGAESLLFEALPLQYTPNRPFCDLHTLVPEVLELYPSWGEDELRNFLEEKIRGRLSPEDLITLRALYLRWYRLRQEFSTN